MARLGHFFLYLLSGIILAAVLLAAWCETRDPLTFLPAPQHNLTAYRTKPVVDQGRRLEHIILPAGALGDIGIVVSLPDPLPVKKLPVLVVLGGLGTGEDNIRSIREPGANAIVGYDWPMPVHFPAGSELLTQMPGLYRHILTIPGQAATAIDWLAAQPWADDTHMSVLGFSLGALAAPAAENLTEHDGHPIGWTIIAYGGAPLGDLFAADPHMKPKWMRVVMGPVIDVLLHPLEPTVNLPYLSSHFLVLEGQDDSLVPAAARAALRAAVPDPKDVIVFAGDHIGVRPGRRILLDSVIAASRSWLVQNGAGNP